MVQKACLFIIIVAALLWIDWKPLKGEQKKVKIAYAAMIAYGLYSGAAYVTDHKLPNFNDAVSYLFGATAGQIDEALKVELPEHEAPVAKEEDTSEEES